MSPAGRRVPPALARIKADALDPQAAVARDLRAMIDAAPAEERAAVEAAAANLRERAGLQ